LINTNLWFLKGGPVILHQRAACIWIADPVEVALSPIALPAAKNFALSQSWIFKATFSFGSGV
jgi:hypothetical protein